MVQIISRKLLQDYLGRTLFVFVHGWVKPATSDPPRGCGLVGIFLAGSVFSGTLSKCSTISDNGITSYSTVNPHLYPAANFVNCHCSSGLTFIVRISSYDS